MSEKLERKDPRFKKIQITVDVYCQWIEDEDGHGRGFTRFRTFVTDVLDDDDNKIGAIGGGTGAVTLTDAEGEEWTLHHDDLWVAFQKALGLDKQEDKQPDPLLESLFLGDDLR